MLTNVLEVKQLALETEVDYNLIGWYIGDSLGRLVLRPAEHIQ